MTPQDYLVEKTGGRQMIVVIAPLSDAWKTAQLPPTCSLGHVLLEVFGRWPSRN